MGLECRCSEIKKCWSDRAILVGAESVIKEMYPEASEIAVNLKTLYAISPQAYETDNIEDICMVINELDEDIEPAISDWLNKIEEEKRRLDEIEENFRSMDEAYHNSLKEMIE